MATFLDGVPGFRSRSVWRVALAVLLYVWAAVLIVRGAAHGYWGTVLLGILMVLLLVLASGRWGLRSRIPLLGSQSKAPTLGWIVLVALALILLAVVPNAGKATVPDNLFFVAGTAMGLVFNNRLVVVPAYIVVTAVVLFVLRRSPLSTS
jgi:hypothetical protein